MPPVGKFTAYFANVSCHSASKHAMCVSRLFVRLFRLFSPRCLASTPASLPSPFRAWVSAQGFAITELARPSHHTESSSRIGLTEPCSLRTGPLLPVALHGRFTPPQFLSTTEPFDLGP